jgi:dTDP-4-amino-4,6-dideoxygalactose transaminase
MSRIPFNRPFIAGKELYYVAQAVTYGNLGGDGLFTQRCARILEQRFGIHKVLMVPSCTAAPSRWPPWLCNLQARRPGDPALLHVCVISQFDRPAGSLPRFVDIRPTR